MQRSCSSWRVSVRRMSPAASTAMMPAAATSESVSVDLPWSTCAMTDMLRIWCLPRGHAKASASDAQEYQGVGTRRGSGAESERTCGSSARAAGLWRTEARGKKPRSLASGLRCAEHACGGSSAAHLHHGAASLSTSSSNTTRQPQRPRRGEGGELTWLPRVSVASLARGASSESRGAETACRCTSSRHQHSHAQSQRWAPTVR